MLANIFPHVLVLCSLSVQQATALSCSEAKQLRAFISEELPIALHGVLANIGPDGSRANGAAAGAVVASPSRTDPDYWYTWTRDSALTLKVLIDRFVDGDETLQPTIENYIAASAKLQGVTNPSGTPLTGGLGEPKFQVNLTEFTGPWGRPQRDGPALRATALTEYANWLLAHGRRAEAAEMVWPVIDKDLAYTVKYWNRTGFDLWEEINGSSFFTLAASHRALVEGSALAKSLNTSCVDCDLSAPRVLCFLQNFFTASTGAGNSGYIDSNINVQDGRTGKDANSLISSIHTFDPESACDDSTFQPCSARALANHKSVVDSFRSIYVVNSNATAGKPAAVGRYAEDVYYNGNPWYIATLAAAEQLYAAIYQWKKVKSIDVTDVSLPFFQDIMPGVSKGTYDENSQTFRKIIKAVRIYADGFFYIVKQHTPADGSLAEQFDRNTGLPKSAVHLTWSYAAFVSAAKRRSGSVPPSWGASGANTVPAVCVAAPTCDASMTFDVKVTTVPGETIVLVGSITELKNWSPPDGIPLSASNYTAENPVWTVTVKVPADTIFEYKYIRKSADGSIMWESDPNNQATSASGCGSSGTINDQWR